MKQDHKRGPRSLRLSEQELAGLDALRLLGAVEHQLAVEQRIRQGQENRQGGGRKRQLTARRAADSGTS